MYYINAKHQKKKEEIHVFYAFPQSFYKKFIFPSLCILHKTSLTALLFLPDTPGEHKLSDKMPQPASRLAPSVTFRKHSAAAQPHFCVEQRFVPHNKLLLIRGRKDRKDTIRLCAVDLIDHALLPVIFSTDDPAACQPDPSAVSSHCVTGAPKLFLCLSK